MNLNYNTLYGGKGEQSIKDRKHILDRVNSPNNYQAVDWAEFMVDNLVDYADNGKHITRKGYEEIRENWKTIWQNSSDMDVDKRRIAESYLLKERERIEGLILEEKILQEDLSINSPLFGISDNVSGEVEKEVEPRKQYVGNNGHNGFHEIPRRRGVFSLLSRARVAVSTIVSLIC